MQPATPNGGSLSGGRYLFEFFLRTVAHHCGPCVAAICPSVGEMALANEVLLKTSDASFLAKKSVDDSCELRCPNKIAAELCSCDGNCASLKI